MMKLLDISNKIDRNTVDIFDIINSISEKLQFNYFVVGAFARDVILKYLYNITPVRRTSDIDIGIQLDSWENFREFVNELLSITSFSRTEIEQRFEFKNNHLIDIIPFGEIAGVDEKYQWKSNTNFEMNVKGFNQALDLAIPVIMRSDPILKIKFASLTYQSVLKIIAWKDGIDRNKKDAIDLCILMINYTDAGNFKRLYEKENDIIIKHGIDHENNSARLLGRDIVHEVDRILVGEIIQILKHELEGHDNQLIIDMMNRNYVNYEFDDYYQLTKSMYEGIIDKY